MGVFWLGNGGGGIFSFLFACEVVGEWRWGVAGGLLLVNRVVVEVVWRWVIQIEIVGGASFLVLVLQSAKTKT